MLGVEELLLVNQEFIAKNTLNQKITKIFPQQKVMVLQKGLLQKVFIQQKRKVYQTIIKEAL